MLLWLLLFRRERRVERIRRPTRRMYANYILVHTLRCWRIVQTGTDGMYINHVERSVHTYVIRVLTTVVCAVHYPRNVPCRRAEIESHKSFHNKKNQAKEVPSTTILLRSSAYTWYLVCHFDCRATNWTHGVWCTVWEWGVPAQLPAQHIPLGTCIPCVHTDNRKYPIRSGGKLAGVTSNYMLN